jgi:hypothetical protein
MSTEHTNNVAATAMAFATYALVPYLGILFCPGALVMGGIGLFRATRSPQPGGARRTALVSLLLGLILLAVHIFLWWILYKVPEWARP